METTKLTLNQARATIYRLLSACFYQPEEAFIEEDIFGQLESALALHDEAWAELARKMGEAFRSTPLDELVFDYTRLFLGPFEILAHPYGSVWLEPEKKMVMGDSTMNALACYRQADFDLDENFRETPDHIAVELEFLYLVTFKENEAMARGDQQTYGELAILKNGFIKNHIGRWVTPFAEAIRQGAQTDFYRLLADLLEQFIRSRIKDTTD